MIYLDYSATTPVLDEVLDTFCKVSKNFVGNPNSLHKLGIDAKQLIEQSTKQIASILGVKEKEVIYTSGSSESNNLAIKGICQKYQNRGKHIITTKLEHSSIYGPVGYLMKEGFEVDFVPLNKEGMVDIEKLVQMIRKDTILISIAAVNSEIGLRQNVEKIGEILKEYPTCFFHVDATQCIGKDILLLENIDLLSFSGHKIYGLKGIGALIKKEKIELEPIIHGGKSTTKYRSGTPDAPLIASLAKALRLSYEHLQENYLYVQKLNEELIRFFDSYKNVSVNHNSHCLPHILNISIIGVKPETFQHALEEFDIYVSTQSACSSSSNSSAVLAFTGSEKKASSSIRISLSAFTKASEINSLKKAFDICYQRLV